MDKETLNPPMELLGVLAVSLLLIITASGSAIAMLVSSLVLLCIAVVYAAVAGEIGPPTLYMGLACVVAIITALVI